MRIGRADQPGRQVHRRAFRASLLRRSGTGHRLHGPRPPARGDRPRAPLGACQGLRPLGGPVARIHPARGAGRRRAAASLRTDHRRPSPAAGRHRPNAFRHRPDHPPHFAIHHAENRRPDLHGHPRRHTTYSPFFRRRTNSPKTRFSPAHWERTRCSSTGRTGSIRSSVLRNSATFTV